MILSLSWKPLILTCLVTLTMASGCASGTVRPTTPTYTGNERPEPSRPIRPAAPTETGAVSDRYADSRSAYIPRHLPRADVVGMHRVAVLLPFSSNDPNVRRLARGLFNAVQLAMFEVGSDRVVLMPKDTGGDAQLAGKAAREAIQDGAVAIIGPLFSQQIATVAAEAQTINAPVLSFSTDIGSLGKGPPRRARWLSQWSTTVQAKALRNRPPDDSLAS
jgi:hypothetical protein